MSNCVWSNEIQGILNLDLSRGLRFRDDRKELFLYLMGIKNGMTVADIGCGTGVLTRKLSSWLDETSKIIGVDRDTNFINYAREKADRLNYKNITYIEGDALDIPLEDNSVDVCVSNTVIEHVPNKEFLLEQKRVCKPCGRVVVMYCRPDKYIHTEPELMLKQSERELELLDKLFKGSDEANEKYKVGKYWPDPVELLMLFEELGFKNIQVDAVSIPVAIDDARNSDEEKLAIIEGDRQQITESINIGFNVNKENLTGDELSELKELANNRFDKRKSMLKENRKIWDYTIASIQIVSGQA